VLLRVAAMDNPVEDWRAVHWFAAAHEAAGKHGAFLSEAICTQACGGDRCTEMAPLEVMRVINLGEPGAAMHRAIWVESSAWPLAAKMQSDFSAAAIARLEEGGGVPVEMNGVHGSVKGTIYVANSVANGVGTSGSNTADALNTADVKTESALKGVQRRRVGR
jgi:hypothetical protein